MCENEQLRGLTGDYYEDYIKVAQSYDDSLPNRDDFDAAIYSFAMVGNMRTAILVVNTEKDTMMTVIPVYDEVEDKVDCLYFSNDPDYPEPPATIMEWLSGRAYVEVG